MLDLLDRHGAKATFFLVADRAAARPELAREILRRGHGIGNHSRSHPQAWFWALGPRRMAAEIDQAQATLRDITGQPPRWFRAVVGMANPFVSASLKKNGLARVAWSARGFDGVRGEPDKVVARIVGQLQPGAIVLLHEGAAHGHNLAIIEGVLEAMRERGYTASCPRTCRSGPWARRSWRTQSRARAHGGAPTVGLGLLAAISHLRFAGHDQPVVERRVAVQRRESGLPVRPHPAARAGPRRPDSTWAGTASSRSGWPGGR